MKVLEIISALKEKRVIPKLEKNQLKLTGETRNLDDAFLAIVKQKKNEIIDFLTESENPALSDPIKRVEHQRDYPASIAQHRLFIISQFEGGNEAYNIIRGFRLVGELHLLNFNEAFRSVIERHEILRTFFEEVGSELRQVVLAATPFEVEYTDLRIEPEKNNIVKNEIEKAVTWAFNLTKCPLIRVRLLRTASNEYVMLFGIHHIISDGWSAGILLNEVMASYEALCRNLPWEISSLTIHYKDYSDWNQAKVKGLAGENSRQFWMTEFPRNIEPLELPYDYQRPSVRTFHGAVSKFYLEPGLVTRLNRFCKNSRNTNFNFLRTLFTILLNKISGQKDIVIGTPLSGRNHYELENQIGLYVNTLPLWVSIAPEDTFNDLLNKISENTFNVLKHQDYPLDSIIGDLKLKRDPGRNPLFDAMLVLQPGSHEGKSTKDQYGFQLFLLDDAIGKIDEARPAKFDLTFNFDYDTNNSLFVEIEYSTDLFAEKSIQRFFDAYCHIAEQVLEYPEIAVSLIDVVTPQEKNAVLEIYNKPVGVVEELSINSLLENSFKKFPNKTALVHGVNRLSYEELDRNSNMVATYLLSISSRQDVVVGLLLDRSNAMVEIILGILKAGMSYLPIAGDYPSQRIRYILEDSKPEIVIAEEVFANKHLGDYRGVILQPNQLLRFCNFFLIHKRNDLRKKTAYTIYTSGSTGNPKGVQICHSNTISFLKWAAREFEGDNFDVLYSATSYCFDLSVFEFLLPLMLGKTIRVLNSPDETLQWGAVEKNILINTVPSVVSYLMKQGFDWKHVSSLNMAGESIPVKIVQGLKTTGLKIRNLYGPTEDTTYSTIYNIDFTESKFIPIGKPIDDTQLYIMNSTLNLLPTGVKGEIYLSGRSIAIGYLNQPVLNKEKFLANPFLPGLRMFKTGDMGRWLPNGDVEFLGRDDEQIKIRGYRIEPGEIKQVLEGFPMLETAFVVQKKIEDDFQLVAYCATKAKLLPSEVKRYLSGILPGYMVPSFYVMMENLPLNSNGKINRNELPDPLSSISSQQEMLMPQNELQKKILFLWKEIFKQQDFGITHNFFDLGGDSLKGMMLKALFKSELKRDISIGQIFLYPTIRSQAEFFRDRKIIKEEIIPLAPLKKYYPISSNQERLWSLHDFKYASTAYYMPVLFKVSGPVMIGHMESACRIVIAQNEILRTAFSVVDGLPMQTILTEDDTQFKIRERTVNTIENLELELDSFWSLPFAFEKGTLFNSMVVQASEKSFLAFNVHHIISDGWSLVIMIRKILDVYAQLVSGTSVNLPKMDLQYKDITLWRKSLLDKKSLIRNEKYYGELFKNGIPVLNLPTDYSRPSVKTFNGDVFDHQLGELLSGQLRILALEQKVSLFTLLFASINILLKKISNQNEIVVGVVTSGRDHIKLYDQIGFYANVLPIKTVFAKEETFLSTLSNVNRDFLVALDHQNYSFEHFFDKINSRRDLSRSPFFDVLFVMQNFENANKRKITFSEVGLEFEHLRTNLKTAKYDLTFTFIEINDSLEIEVEYNTDLFKKKTIESLIENYMVLLKSIIDIPERTVESIEFITKSEAKKLLREFNNTKLSYPSNKSVMELFERQAAIIPDQVALIFEKVQLTYDELNSKSNQFAWFLKRTLDVVQGEIVGVKLPRTEWLIITILGIIKSGATYIPLDPDYPNEHIDFIVSDSKCKSVIDEDVINLFRTVEGDYSTRNLGLVYNPNDLIYIIYTSGSTGHPKGAMVKHHSFTNLNLWYGRTLNLSVEDRVLLVAPISFDLAQKNVFSPLIYGATICLTKRLYSDYSALATTIENTRVSVVNSAPSAFYPLLDARTNDGFKKLKSLRKIVLGGEPIRLNEFSYFITSHFFNADVINSYGPTECTDVVSSYTVSKEDWATLKNVPIGTPIDNTEIYILNESLGLVPIGIIGEIFISGECVGSGYLNRPELSSEKFIVNPFIPKRKMYRTGDLGRWLSDGNIEFIGRNDSQVKVRGFRIEISEIESKIQTFPDLNAVVVIARKNKYDDNELIAFLQSEKKLDVRQVRSYLGNVLPHYMIPDYFVQLDFFPLTPSGKINRKGFPEFDDIQVVTDRSYVAPTKDIEIQVASIWQEVLNLEKIGLTDNFFELGGNSLKATRVISKIFEVFGVRLDMKDLFIDPTINYLVSYIETVHWIGINNEIVSEDEDEIIF